MSVYQNKTNNDLVLPGFGVVEAGGTIELPADAIIENPNLELVENQPAAAATAAAAAPAAPAQPVQAASPAPVASVPVATPNQEVKS